MTTRKDSIEFAIPGRVEWCCFLASPGRSVYGGTNVMILGKKGAWALAPEINDSSTGGTSWPPALSFLFSIREHGVPSA